MTHNQCIEHVLLFTFTDIPCVVTLAPVETKVDCQPSTVDGVEYCEALRRLAEAGADVVGFNCARGSTTMLPLLERAVKECKVMVPYVTQ